MKVTKIVSNTKKARVKNNILVVVLYITLLVFTNNNFAATNELAPFNSKNLSPFVQIFGLPFVESSQLLNKGDIHSAFNTELINNFTRDNNSQERIVIDGETYRSTLVLRYGFSETINFGIDIPYISHQGGFIDSSIEGWHEIFGLSNTERKKSAENELSYTYSRDGKEFVNINSSEEGVGDILLSVAYQLKRSTHSNDIPMVVRAGVKLPTGESESLLGSGDTDYYLSLSSSLNNNLFASKLLIYGNLGILNLGKSKLFEEIQRDNVVFASLGVGWQPKKWFGLKAQFDSHTSFYKSELIQLSANATQIVFGGTLFLSQKTKLDIAFYEDLVEDTAPDFVFQLGIQRDF